jgi:sulfate transport system ATP-binding protein
MSFVGPVNKLDDAWVRPHDVELRHEPNGNWAGSAGGGAADPRRGMAASGRTREAQIERIVRLGFETRVELVRDDGERLYAQLTRNEAEELELERGDIVYVRTRKETTFDEPGTPQSV